MRLSTCSSQRVLRSREERSGYGKALYGLKQGGCKWYNCINDFFTKSIGLVCTFADHSIYIYKTKHSIVMVPVMVWPLLLPFSSLFSFPPFLPPSIHL